MKTWAVGGMTKRRWTRIILSSGLLLGSLRADVVSYDSFYFTPGGSVGSEGANDSAYFPQFDPLGQLNSVTVTWTLNIQGLLPYIPECALGGSCGVAPYFLIFGDIYSGVTGTVDQAPFSQQHTDTGNFFWQRECQCFLYPGFSASGTESPTNLAPYLGDGAWSLPFSFTLEDGAEPDSQIAVGPLGLANSFGYNLTGTVTYDYTPAPEPQFGAAVFLGLAIIVLFVKRHHCRHTTISG
jgi:hypothetical protein